MSERHAIVVVEKFEDKTDVRVIGEYQSKAYAEEVSSGIKWAGKRGQPYIIPASEVPAFVEKYQVAPKPEPTPEEIKAKATREKEYALRQRIQEAGGPEYYYAPKKQEVEFAYGGPTHDATPEQIKKAIVEGKPYYKGGKKITPEQIESQAERRKRVISTLKQQSFQQRLKEFPYEKLGFKTAEEWKAAGYEVKEKKIEQGMFTPYGTAIFAKEVRYKVPTKLQRVEKEIAKDTTYRILPEHPKTPYQKFLHKHGEVTEKLMLKVLPEKLEKPYQKFVSGFGEIMSGIETGAYTEIRERPLRIVGTFAFGLGAGTLGKIAMTSKVGSKVFQVGATALGLTYAGGRGYEIYKAPTLEAKGEVVGETAVDLLAFGAGLKVGGYVGTGIVKMRKPPKVRIGVAGEMYTMTKPKTDVKIAKIKPVDMSIEVKGKKMIGTGKGLATVKKGRVAALYEFQIKPKGKKTIPAKVAVKGKIWQDKKITKSVAGAEAITGKVVDRRIILGKAKEIVSGDFPIYHTGVGELGKGRIGKVTPKYVRAGRVVKEGEIVKDVLYKGKPTLVTIEKYAFREKGVSAREMEAWYATRKKPYYLTEEMFKRMEVQRLLREQKTRADVFGVGGLVPPVEVTKPPGKVKPVGTITEQFLASARVAVRAEWLSGIQKSKVWALPSPQIQRSSIDVVTRPYVDIDRRTELIGVLKPEVSAKEYMKERIGLIGAVKPSVSVATDVSQRTGLVSALRPSTMVKQQVEQRALTKTITKPVTMIFPVTPPIPIPTTPAFPPFLFPFPKPKKEKKRKRGLYQFGFRYRWTPSLSWVLGGRGYPPTVKQATGEGFVSPVMLRGVRKKKK